MQIGILCMTLLAFTCLLTFMALRRPRGPQPATYGHLQTLANLVDEWSPVMWWGHKEDGIPYCHAGTVQNSSCILMMIFTLGLPPQGLVIIRCQR